MIKKKIKKIIKSILKIFGYRIVKLNPSWLEICSNPYEIQRRLIKNPNDDLTIFDVGAYHGYTALHYKRLFPNSLIFCFEPFPESYATLCKSIGDKSGFKVFNLGLSNHIGEADFYVNEYSPTNSILTVHPFAHSIWGENLLNSKFSIKVELSTLDEIVFKNNIKRIDILKLDVQGAESRVILGGLQSLKKGIVKIVYTEIITLPTYQNQTGLNEMISLFDTLGYELFSIYNLPYTNEGKLRQIDAIFTLKDLN